MKKILLLLSLMFLIHLHGDDLIVFNNEYKIVPLQKSLKKVIVGNQEMINVSLLKDLGGKMHLKIFGKKVGNTSLLLLYKDATMQNYHIYVNENLGYIQKMINSIEPTLKLNRVGDGATVITGKFKDPHNKNRVYQLLQSAGIELNATMDLTQTRSVNRMIRTKLYLVEINNQKAKDLGGITGLGFLDGHTNININPTAANGATFSGWLLDNAGQFTGAKGKSITGTLNFLQEKGVGKILDDTVLISTEDKNSSFRVGGEVYIPIGITQNAGYAPTINVEEREYGLTLTIKTKFLEKDDYMHLNVAIVDSEFDTNAEHNVKLGIGVEVPSFVSKNIQTNVVIKSGQVVALGGRLHSEDTKQVEKVPILGDIPLLGELFKHTVSATKGNDLLFFLVPEIVDANENIDDTKFYRDFSKDSLELKKQILDMNATMQDKKQNEPSLVVKNDNVPDTVALQEAAEDINNTQEVVIVDEQTNNIAMDVTKTEAVKESTELEKQTAAKDDLYAVSIEHIYVRDNPSLQDSKRIDVWSKGHKFKSAEEVSKDGITWIKITQDCQQECHTLEMPLWISKKYTEKTESSI